MNNVEIYKLRTHRTPIACATALLIGVLTPSVVLTWYTPKDPMAYTSNFTVTYGVLSVLLGIVFGGWLLGTEYRQHTVKRMLTSEPRRLRALTTKGLTGATTMSAVLTTVGVIGWGVARLVGSMNDVAVPWEGRSILAATLSGLIVATIAFCFSAITRSDSFAMVGTVTLVLVLGPLLMLIPRVGKYTLGSALDGVSQAVSGSDLQQVGELSTTAAAVVLALWIMVLMVPAAVLFARRDV